MDLKTYILSLDKEDREPFGRRCGSSIAHIQNCAYRTRVPSAELAMAIERESKGAVTRQELLPTKFEAIWPDLKAA